MNWDAAAAIGSLLAFVAVVVSAAVTHGKLTQRVDNSEARLDDHDDLHKDHIAHFSRVDIALVRLEEYNRGFTDASRLKANT